MTAMYLFIVIYITITNHIVKAIASTITLTT
jgi:hypothetical protein